ncbi:hypothetical protein SLEP1_g6813 [Rubroshorea leprosula]|nr:hypothetical protein SLEP1_g6813 [Rubroshorea leprosula]
MTERLDLAFKEQNQAMRRLVKSQAESSRRQEEIIRQCMEDMRWVFEEGTRVMRETGEESRRTLQAVSEQVIQEAPIPALGEQGNQPHPNIQQQNFFMGEGQRQHEPMEAAALVADHGHQPQHSLPQNSVFSWRQMEDLFHTQFYRCESEVSMADLSRLAQKPGESSEAFLARFRRARLKCRVALLEQEFVKLAQNGLDIEFRWKFEGMEFRYFYELSYKVAQYKNLLKEDVQKKAASHGTYYSDRNFDHDVVEVVADKPVVCLDLVKPTHLPETSVRHKAKETMGVDEDPFLVVFVGVNVADLKSVARNRSLPYAQRNLVAEDLRWVLEAQRSRHSRSIRLDQQRLGRQGRIIVTRNFSAESGRRYSNGTRSPRMVKPPLRSPSRRWKKVSHPKFPAQNSRTLRRRL